MGYADFMLARAERELVELTEPEREARRYLIGELRRIRRDRLAASLAVEELDRSGLDVFGRGVGSLAHRAAVWLGLREPDVEVRIY